MKKQFGVVVNGLYPLNLEVWMSLDTFSRYSVTLFAKLQIGKIHFSKLIILLRKYLRRIVHSRKVMLLPFWS